MYLGAVHYLIGSKWTGRKREEVKEARVKSRVSTGRESTSPIREKILENRVMSQKNGWKARIRKIDVENA